MKLAFTSSAKGFFAAVFLSSAAYAVPTITLNPGNVTESPQLYGGMFTAYSATLSNADYGLSARGGNILYRASSKSFETFCMAYDQDFAYGDVLSYALTDHTKDSSPGTIMGLTSGVAYLYSQFAKGALSINQSYEDTAFQMAIWTLQHSKGAPSIGSLSGYTSMVNQYNTYMNLANSHGGSALALANNYGVQVILTGYGTYNSTNETFGTQNRFGQSFDRAHGYSQPQLYYHHVPDAGTTVTLLGLSLLGIAGYRRKLAARR